MIIRDLHRANHPKPKVTVITPLTTAGMAGNVMSTVPIATSSSENLANVRSFCAADRRKRNLSDIRSFVIAGIKTRKTKMSPKPRIDRR